MVACLVLEIWLLITMRCLLSVVRELLLVLSSSIYGCRSAFVVWCCVLLCKVCCLWYVARCLMVVVFGVLCAIRCALFVVGWLLYVAPRLLLVGCGIGVC